MFGDEVPIRTHLRLSRLAAETGQRYGEFTTAAVRRRVNDPIQILKAFHAGAWRGGYHDLRLPSAEILPIISYGLFLSEVEACDNVEVESVYVAPAYEQVRSATLTSAQLRDINGERGD